MIELKQFRSKLQSFPSNYLNDFDEFWKWKLKEEKEKGHILDESHREETGHWLRGVLSRWQTYRGARHSGHWRFLEDSLERISGAYDQIRRHSLLEFDEVSKELLELIWHELGRVKERDQNRSSVTHFIISVCKPLMLLWGQTLAFDSRNRSNIPPEFNVPRGTRWSFGEWKRAMERFQEELEQSHKFVSYCKELSLDRYGTDSVVPYGRFLDIYYF